MTKVSLKSQIAAVKMARDSHLAIAKAKGLRGHDHALQLRDHLHSALDSLEFLSDNETLIREFVRAGGAR